MNGVSSKLPPPRKRFAQHFLTDAGVLSRLVDCLGLHQDDQVLEIGPGRGALTAMLTNLTRRCVAVEIDRDLAPRLASRFPNLEVINADVLTFDFRQLGNGRPWRVVGNLPYNISTPLLFRMLALNAGAAPAFSIQDMHFMLQREVAQRLASGPGVKAWGRLSVAAQCHCAVTLLFEAPPQSFSPPPQVHSAFVRLRPHGHGRTPPPNLDAVLRQAFSARRKRVSNALRSLALDWDALDIDAKARPEQLSAADFLRIARAAQHKDGVREARAAQRPDGVREALAAQRPDNVREVRAAQRPHDVCEAQAAIVPPSADPMAQPQAQPKWPDEIAPPRTHCVQEAAPGRANPDSVDGP